MKKIFKAGWIVLALGIVSLIIGIAFNGVRDIEFNGLKPQVAQKNRRIEKTYAKKEFTKINLKDLEAVAEVEIRQGTTYSIKYDGNSQNEPEITYQGDQVVIQRRQKLRRLTGFASDVYEAKLVITVPKDQTLENITFDKFFTGSVFLKGLTLQNLEINADLSELTLEQVNSARTKIDSSVGSEVTLRDSNLKDGELNFDYGDLKVYGGSLQNIQVAQDAGDVYYQNGTVLENGSTRLEDGTFKAENVTFHGHYTVTNESGNNRATNVNVTGFRLVTEDGTNKLHEQTSKDQLETGMDQADTLSLTTEDGDNIVE